MEPKRVAVIGTGTIGASWVAYFLARGLEVVASDPASGAEAFVHARVAQAWPLLEKLGTVIRGAHSGRLRFESEIEKAAEGVDFIQENGPEREDAKVELFRKLDAVAAPKVPIASSSSGLLISTLQSKCRHPERCIIGHPFNPPHLMPLVEVVGGEKTSRAIVERVMNFYRSLGKHPIQLKKEVRGHLANRLQAALWREAVHLVAEGVATVADIDAAMTQGPGLRWAIFGPHLVFHLGGGNGGMSHFLHHLLGPVMGWWDDLGNPQMTPELQKKLIAGVEAEAAGRSIPELAEQRDEKLVALLRALGS